MNHHHRVHRTPALRAKSTVLALVTAPGLLLTACGTDGKPAPVDVPRMTVTPADGAHGVKPADPIAIRVDHGTLGAVSVTAADGRQVGGAMRDGTFVPEAPLATKSTYQVRATLKGADGKETEAHSSFTTLEAKTTETVTVLPSQGATVGVGQPVSLTFDHPVKDKAAVERRLKLTTDNNTEGSWGWVKETLSDKDRIDWRPKAYWKPGTKVTLRADLNGVDTGAGRYLVRSYSTDFTIGKSQIAKIDLNTHRLTFERDGQDVKTMPVTGGDEQHETWNGKMTLMAKEGTIRMNSQTVGMGSAYDQQVQKSMRLTISGTYAHQAEWAESTIGTANTSHGCLGFTTADATWLYDQVQVGDVFEVTGGKETVAAGNGYGEWNLGYADWQHKSALRQGN
ncbi:Ig-like domain-containing protein [Streptomyces sp. NPDC002506]|uniref:L,D-transpeptidase n=1 Tax=Streptomyces sp. NPDC002506 TaxID=3154536 RepID=UPI00332694F4